MKVETNLQKKIEYLVTNGRGYSPTDLEGLFGKDTVYEEDYSDILQGYLANKHRDNNRSWYIGGDEMSDSLYGTYRSIDYFNPKKNKWSSMIGYFGHSNILSEEEGQIREETIETEAFHSQYQDELDRATYPPKIHPSQNPLHDVRDFDDDFFI